MLMGLLSPDWNTSMPFLDSLAAWDVECLEYTSQSGQQLTDATKIAVVTSHCPEQAKWVVRMASLQMGDDYRSFKSQLELYFKQTLSFTSAGGLDSSGPMDVGGIGKGGKFGKRGDHRPAAGTVCKVCNKT